MFDDFVFRFGDHTYDLLSKTYIMGILNVTPDSFSDGGKYTKAEEALKRAKEIESEGADFIDIGGQSTRPGSKEISVDEELERVIPILEAVKDEINIPISIDTYRSKVAEEALKSGAMIVNDITGLNYDPEMPKVINKYKASCIVMHSKGKPENMQDNPEYENVVAEVTSYLENSIWKANISGIDQIIIDPGIGFGKTVEHNLTLIKHIPDLKRLDCPILIGVSRKSLIGKILNTDVGEHLEGSLALDTISILNGVNILRVHDVKESVRIAKITDSYLKTE